jgi:hypothetical protein
MFNFRFFHLSAFVLFVVVQAFASSARAQIPLPQPVNSFYTPSGAKYFNFTGDDVRAFDRATLAIDSGGKLAISPTRSLTLDAGRVVDVVPKYKLPGAAVGKALTNFAKKLITPLVVGVAIYDLARDLGFNLDNSSGASTVSKNDPLICSSAPCYEYSTRTWSSTSNTATGYFPTRAQACEAYRASFPINGFAPYTVFQSSSDCIVKDKNGSQAPIGSYASRSVSPSAPGYLPSSMQELEDAIASQSGWPSNSKVVQAVKDAVASGESIPLPAPESVTGPASVPGPTSTKTTPAQNGDPAKTVTTSTTTNITYEGNKVTTNNITTTVTNTTINGEPVTTTETEETEPEATPTDSANPDLPKLYERKYPNGLTGVWTTRKAELMATSLPNLIGSLSPTITGSGGCPQFSIPLDIGPWHWGTYNLGPSCAVWEFIKLCVLIGAAFLVRALVFGG